MTVPCTSARMCLNVIMYAFCAKLDIWTNFGSILLTVVYLMMTQVCFTMTVLVLLVAVWYLCKLLLFLSFLQ